MTDIETDDELTLNSELLEAFHSSEFGRAAMRKLGVTGSETFRIYSVGFVGDDPQRGANVQGCEFEFNPPDSAGKVFCRPVPGTTLTVQLTLREIRAERRQPRVPV